MTFPFVLTAISGFISVTASRVIAMVAGRKLKEKKASRSSVISHKEKERINQAQSQYFRGKAQREKELIAVQSDLVKIRETEVLANIEIAKSQAQREEISLEISEANLRLKEQEVEILKARMDQEFKMSQAQLKLMKQGIKLRQKELKIMEEDLIERRKIGYLNLELQHQKEINRISLKLTEFQSNWDRENWTGIMSREEMQRLLVASQKKCRLLMIVSPPDISDCLDFNNNLQKEVRSEVKEFIEKYYPLNEDCCPVEYYGKLFKSAIFDVEVKQLESDLSPIPTVVIYSDITDQKIYFHVRFWGLESPLSLTLPWHWREERQKLNEKGLDERESIVAIRQAIVKIHQLIAAFLADLYYLHVNPLHQPRLFEMDAEVSAEWVKANVGVLREFQNQKLADYHKVGDEKFELIELFFEKA